jgi:cell division protein FtsL
MTEYLTRKRIDNSRLVRQMAPNRLADYARVAALGGIIAAGGLLYAWQHFQCLELGYRLEELKSARAQAVELNQQLKLEAAALSSPMRIDAIARQQLGLTAPVPGQVAPVEGPREAVLARARYSVSGTTQ